MWRLLSSDGRYVSVLHRRTRDVIRKFVVYLRINFRLSNLTRSPTTQHEVFLLLLVLQSVVKLNLFQSCPPLLSVLLLTCSVPQAHVLQIFLI